MKLSNDQEKAMQQIMEWRYDRRNWMFYLGGYAGTGKTTLLQEIIDRLEQPAICLAPTGKAASVLQKKLTGVKVRTIHSALYKPVMPDISQLEELEYKLAQNPGAKELIEAIRTVKQELADQPLNFMNNDSKEIGPLDLVMVDEASMVTSKMVDDLQRTEAKVLFCGDPGQLPPVKEKGFFFTIQPDAMLLEVQRQALDNPIIALSMAVRQNTFIRPTIENANILRRSKKGYEFIELVKADQVLVGMNFTRQRVNRALRKILHPDSVGIKLPVAGEKLICLKNQYARGGWIVNGMQCLSASACTVEKDGSLLMDVLYEGQLLNRMDCYHYPFVSHYRTDAEQDPWAARTGLAEFDYGYAVTVHKSQGSEWNRVVLVDDGMFGNNPKTRRQWLYTAITRAKEHLTWLT